MIAVPGPPPTLDSAAPVVLADAPDAGAGRGGPGAERPRPNRTTPTMTSMPQRIVDAFLPMPRGGNTGKIPACRSPNP
ncbi:hypothetical protein J2X68_004248 [Streptomyces sp. 3330]|uniref:hypothetical protein n=1 Tax=Streptomyces sp. 3330 TaxID=2817755 RepID=UPI00285FF67E|nr:hypothetical protein [Streptomyces sp. 3330]MDR6977529.1 hypothetical protein [Streptomyces sp. 3330]